MSLLKRMETQQIDYKFVQNSFNFNCGVKSSSHWGKIVPGSSHNVLCSGHDELFISTGGHKLPAVLIPLLSPSCQSLALQRAGTWSPRQPRWYCRWPDHGPHWAAQRPGERKEVQALANFTFVTSTCPEFRNPYMQYIAKHQLSMIHCTPCIHTR